MFVLVGAHSQLNQGRSSIKNFTAAIKCKVVVSSDLAEGNAEPGLKPVKRHLMKRMPRAADVDVFFTAKIWPVRRVRRSGQSNFAIAG